MKDISIVYKATDGREFQSFDRAQEHQKYVDIKELLLPKIKHMLTSNLNNCGKISVDGKYDFEFVTSILVSNAEFISNQYIEALKEIEK